MQDLQAIARQFQLEAPVLDVAPLGDGLINDTYKITCQEIAGKKVNYVLQRINHAIFQDVPLMQDNIDRITRHIRNKLQARGEQDLDRKVLRFIPALDGKLWYHHAEEDSWWRVSLFIEDSVSYNAVTPELARRTGWAFGDFQSMLADLPGEPLGETIPNFHNMPFRLEQLQDAVTRNAAGRLEETRDIYEAIMARAEESVTAARLYQEGKLPKRTTHCDTKVNNMLFDKEGNFLCVIDLDTTMPGFVLSDFGDFIRTAGNTAAEDEPDLSKVGLNMEVFKAFAQGYIEGTRNFLSPTERKLLPYGAKLLTYMQTVRFYLDYLNGDTYYRIAYKDHNLVRTRNQLTLLQSLEAHEQEMNDFIASLA